MRLSNIVWIVIFIKLICKKFLIALQTNSIINNIANKHSFFLQMLELLKYNEKTKKYIYIKKAIYLKNKTIFNFMICPSNNKLEVIENPLLDIVKPKVKRCNDTNSEIIQTKFNFIKLLKIIVSKDILSYFL